MFLHAWGLHGSGCACGCESHTESEKLLHDAQANLMEIEESGLYDGFGILKIVNASSKDDDLLLDGRVLPALRQQRTGSNYLSITDFVNPSGDYVGVFLVGAGNYINELRLEYEKKRDSYHALMLQSLADRLAEASSELMHFLVRKEYWGYSQKETLDVERILKNDFQGIRPAIGYPMLPDQLLNKDIYELLLPESAQRVELTENGAMYPSSTVSGLYIADPDARYFLVGRIGSDQLEDYALRRGITVDRINEILRQ